MNQTLDSSLGRMRPLLKYRDVIKLLEANGWRFERMGLGDHMIYRHPTRPGAVVVAGGGRPD